MAVEGDREQSGAELTPKQVPVIEGRFAAERSESKVEGKGHRETEVFCPVGRVAKDQLCFDVDGQNLILN